MNTNMDGDVVKLIDKVEDKKDCILMLSMLVSYTRKPKYFNLLQDYILENNDEFPVNTQFYLYQQVLGMKFRYDFTCSDDSQLKMDEWILNILQNYRENILGPKEQISLEKRNKNLIFVVTDQFLGKTHAPTNLAMQWCEELVRNGKSVMLINTAEIATNVGAIPFDGYLANYMPEYSALNEIEIGEIKVPFFQCDQNMPDIDVLKVLLSVVEKECPEMIISFGDTVFSYLANQIVPVYTVALGSAMPRSFTKYRMLIGEKKTELEKRFMEQFGFSDDSIIKAGFTFSLPKQKEQHFRQEFGISKDSFCLLVIGTRLEADLTDEFMEMLDGLLNDERLSVLFVGQLDYEHIVCPYKNVLDRSNHISHAQDLLSIVELGDLYINPTRMGGGTSALFALKKGKPVVTVDYGDVALNAGDEFCVSDYESMQDIIKKYLDDSSFYESMSNIAKQRASTLTEADNPYYKQVQEIEKREEESCCY